jgi:adenosylcobinamide-GDP ribazoletransferase
MNAFWLALRFLTILPLGQAKVVDAATVAAAGKYYSLVGLIFGGLAWGFFQGAAILFPPAVAVGLLILFWVVLSGALHLDGLADCLDGLYGGNTPDERLTIMKDVHLGTMGIVGLILILGIKYLALKEIFSISSQGMWVVLIPAISRWTSILLAFLFPYARPGGGLGQALVLGTGKKELFWATLLAWGPVLFWSPYIGLGLIAVIGVWSVGCGWYFQKKIGGITGDVCGAVIESSEVWGMLYILGAASL